VSTRGSGLPSSPPRARPASRSNTPALQPHHRHGPTRSLPSDYFVRVADAARRDWRRKRRRRTIGEVEWGSLPSEEGGSSSGGGSRCSGWLVRRGGLVGREERRGGGVAWVAAGAAAVAGRKKAQGLPESVVRSILLPSISTLSTTRTRQNQTGGASGTSS
jgi:hypothetical protein